MNSPFSVLFRNQSSSLFSGLPRRFQNWPVERFLQIRRNQSRLQFVREIWSIASSIGLGRSPHQSMAWLIASSAVLHHIANS
jgi:hypothetical protein